MMMISGINASQAALSTFSKTLSSTAGNIANVNTDGYKGTVATINDDNAGLPQVSLKTPDAPGALLQEGGVVRETSNVDLAQEMPQMMISQAGYEANIKALEAQNNVLKSTIDMII